MSVSRKQRCQMSPAYSVNVCNPVHLLHHANNMLPRMQMLAVHDLKISERVKDQWLLKNVLL